MDIINGYRLTTELKNDKSGYAKWGFATKNGSDYFIKEFLTPVYPPDDPELSELQKRKKRNICEEFERTKKHFYNQLHKCSTGNVVIVSDFFRFRNKYYIITEKIDATPIEPDDMAKMSTEQILLIMKIILFCVAALHDNGIVHGDIKPDNILFKQTKKGVYTAKIIDFDSSFLESDPPSGDDIQGDMVYMAPETFMLIAEEEGNLTSKIDVFALGVLFHQYFSSELPGFDREEYNYTFEAVLDGCDLKLSPRIPMRVLRIIKRMLSRDPGQRPSVQEIFHLLNDAEDVDEETKTEPSEIYIEEDAPVVFTKKSGIKSSMGKNRGKAANSHEPTKTVRELSPDNPIPDEPVRREAPKGNPFKRAGDL